MSAQLDRFAAAAEAALGLPGAPYTHHAVHPQPQPRIFNRIFKRIESYPQAI